VKSQKLALSLVQVLHVISMRHGQTMLGFSLRRYLLRKVSTVNANSD